MTSFSKRLSVGQFSFLDELLNAVIILSAAKEVPPLIAQEQ